MFTKLLHSGFSWLHLLQLKETATQFATKIFLDIPKYFWTLQWKETDTHFATKIFLDPSRVFWKEGCLKNHYILLFVFFMYCGLYFSYLVVCIFSSPPRDNWWPDWSMSQFVTIVLKLFFETSSILPIVSLWQMLLRMSSHFNH